MIHWFTSFFKKKTEEPPHPLWRISKVVWPDGKEEYIIEKWTSHYSLDYSFWASLSYKFDTHQNASNYITLLSAPPVKPVITIVEERY